MNKLTAQEAAKASKMHTSRLESLASEIAAQVLENQIIDLIKDATIQGKFSVSISVATLITDTLITRKELTLTKQYDFKLMVLRKIDTELGYLGYETPPFLNLDCGYEISWKH